MTSQTTQWVGGDPVRTQPTQLSNGGRGGLGGSRVLNPTKPSDPPFGGWEGTSVGGPWS